MGRDTCATPYSYSPTQPIASEPFVVTNGPNVVNINSANRSLELAALTPSKNI